MSAYLPMTIKKSLAWLGLAQAISVILQFASSVVLARYLTPYEMGIFAVAVATVAMLSVFQQLGLNALIVREEVLTEEVSSTAFTVNALLSIALSLVVVAASYGGAAFLGDEGVRHVLLVLAVPPLLGILSFLPAANLERHGRFRDLALVTTAGGVVSAGVTIALAVLGLSYMSVAYAQLAGSGLMTALLVIVGRRHFRTRVGLTSWRRVTDFAFQMLAVSGINNASQRLSEIMLARLLGLGSLGIYNRASGLSSLIWTNFHMAVSRVVLVDYADLNRRGVSLRERYLQTVAIVTAVLWPAFAGLAVLAEPFIVIVYGERWAAAVTPFVFLAIASMILVSITMTWELFTSTNQLRAQTRIEFKRMILSITLFVGACAISLEAAAATRIVDALIALVMYRPHLNRMTGTRTADFWGIYARSALLTVFAVTPAAALMLLDVAGGPAGQAPLPFIFGAVALGILFWGWGLFALGHPLAAELGGTVRNRLRAFRPQAALSR